MKTLALITKCVGYDTGVVVSMRHLNNILLANNIPVKSYYYEDDQELLDIIYECEEDYINIHVPSFSDETLKKILETSKRVILSIHSTLCNLQAEEGMLERIVNIANLYKDRIYISCPSKREVVAMNALNLGRFIHLPNTFSYPLLSEQKVKENAIMRLAKVEKNIGMFCAYRPLKNLPVQIAATCMNIDYPIKLCFFKGNDKHPLYRAINKMVSCANLNALYWPNMSNIDFYNSIDNIYVLMQVSLSETLSYVALEHMARGIPVIGSTSIPFASYVVDYSDVNVINEALVDVLDKDNYLEMVIKTRNSALSVIEQNNRLAVQLIDKFLSGDLSD